MFHQMRVLLKGCRHGLAQWAVNMFQGELFGYANYIHLKKMIPSGVKYFWEDIVCKIGSGQERLVVLMEAT